MIAARLLRRLAGGTALLAAAVVAGAIVLDCVFPPPLERAGVVSTVVTDMRGVPLRAFPVEDGRWRLRADIDAIDPSFVRALISIEDRNFYEHGGVDVLALARAAWTSARAGRVVSGASTITMQTARLMEPRPRTFTSKLIEMARAIQIERRLSKDEILELYLTLAPYGGNLEGVRAASWAYFQREPEQLTPDQTALLIALPQAPEARRPDRRPVAAVAARARILNRLTASGQLAQDRARDAAGEPAPARHAFPAFAWHGAEEARDRATTTGDVRATLDFALQREMEGLALSRAGEQADDVQVALLVIEIESRAVRAAVGSADRNRAGGWIDLTDRARSPGSTLKSLIYGLAFDDGLAAGTTQIADAPRRFASYQPDNFDRTFRGDVTVAQALQHSLNVPAVHTLDAVGARRFASALAFAGAAPTLPAGRDEDAGLAIALGGVGLTARQLGVLYAALGDQGRAAPLRWLEDEPLTARSNRRRMMSSESAREILDILQRAPAPSGRMPAALTREAPIVAFKTGTSYGYRDAWAVGVAGGHAVVVWVGRADGAPRPGQTGRAAALPILFEAFDQIALNDPAMATGLARQHVAAPVAETPSSLARFGDDGGAPEILFPPDGAELWWDRPDRAFIPAARGVGELVWYVDGERLGENDGGDAVWRPAEAGFFTLTVVNAAGRSAATSVRVRSP